MRRMRAWQSGALFCALFASTGGAALQPLVISNRWSGALLAQEQIVSVTVTTQQVVSGLSRPVIGLFPADVDGDGAVDLLAAGYEGNQVFWMRNTGAGTSWLMKPVAQGISKPRAVGAGDLNTNGTMDVVASVSGSNTLMAWCNIGGAGTNWTGHVIDASFGNAFSIVVKDVDGDGRRDVVSASSSGNEVAWWRNANGLGTSWSKHSIATGFSQALDAQCADLDGDGDMDVAGVAYAGNKVAWWENVNGDGQTWTEHTVATGFSTPYALALSDLDGDGDVDITACSDGGVIRVWRNNGSGTVWTEETVVSAGFEKARSVWCADLDGDGDQDIAAASFDADQAAWFEQRQFGWTKWIESSTVTGAISVCCADFNADGRPDVAASSYSQKSFNAWYNEPHYGVGPFSLLSTPVSTNWIQSGKRAICVVTNSPMTSGTTQWVCRGWTGAGSIVSGTGTNTGGQVVSMPSSMQWDWSTRFYLTVTNDGHGLATVSSGWQESGATVTMQAVPTTPGYVFVSWSGVPVALATNNPLELTITNAMTIKANFGTDGRVITAVAGPNGGVSPSGEVAVAFGGSQSFEITPDPGWRIARIVMNGEECGVSDWVTFSNVREDGTLWVEFARAQVALKVTSPYGVTEPEAGTTEFYDGGTTAKCAVLNSPISVGAYTQMVCSGWTGTGSAPVSGEGVETPEFVITEYSTVSWQWKTQALLQVFYSGSGTSNPSRAWCDSGSEVEITAQPDEGYVFNGWSGDVPNGAERDNPITLHMMGTKSLTASFGLFRPTIHAAAENHGIIAPSGDLSVDYLSTPEFVITPDEDYQIESVLLDGVSIGVRDSYQFEPVTDDHTIVATFRRAVYDLEVISAHGSADPAPGTNVLAANGVFQCRLAGSPETNGVGTQYVCRGWTGTGSVPGSGATLDTGLLLLSSHSSITWNWATQYWLSVTGAVGGSVSGSNGWYDAGTALSLQAVPAAGWSFAGWSGDVDGLNTNANPLPIEWTCARGLTAAFEPARFTITATSGANGSITPSGQVSVAYGAAQTFSITAAPSWRIDDVKVDAVSVGAVSAYTFTNVVTNHTIQAGFVNNVYTLIIASQHGTPSPAGTDILPAGTVLTCTVGGSPWISGTTQYVCTGWTGTGSVAAAGTTTNTDPFALTQNTSLTWNWLTNYWLTARAGSNGQVSPTGAWYAAGTTNAAVEAYPNGGYKFAGWSGDVPASMTNQNPLLLEMTRARIVRANFSTNAVSITTVVRGAGAVAPESAQVAPGGEALFTVTPVSGFRIVNLMINSNGIPITNYYGMSVRFTNVTQDAVLTAEFGENTFSLSVDSAFGEATPESGLHTYAAGQSVRCSLSGSPSLTATGRTRRIFTWWAGTGSVPPDGTETNVLLEMRHDSSITWNWKTQHLMQVTLSGAGSINVPTNAWYDATGSVELVALPDTYNRFVRWTGDVPAEAATNNPLTLAMDMPRDLGAVFAADQLDLVVVSEHGSPEPPAGVMTYAYGTVLAAYVPHRTEPTNALGTQYVCVGWSGTGSVPTSGTATNTGNFTLTENSTLRWNWQTNYECTALASAGGTVSVSGRWFAAASMADVTATALDGYLFAGWSGDTGEADTNSNPIALGMTSARSVTAQFVTNRPALTVVSEYAVTDPSVGTHAGDYARVQVCSVTSNPVVQGGTRYRCIGWTGTGSVPATGALDTVSVLVTNESSITWRWQRQFRLTATGGLHGTVTPASAWFDGGSTGVTVLALAETGWQFAGWSGDTGFADTNRNPIALTMDRARDVYAAFVPLRPSFTVANPHGSCEPPPGVYKSHLQGTEIECLLYETPYPSNAAGTQYICRGWTGTGSVPATGTGVYVKVTLNTNSVLTWHWSTQFWFEASASGGGIVNPTGGWYDAGASVTVTPVAAAAHRFDRWTGDIPSPGATGDVPLVVTLDRARSMVAHFSSNRPVLTVRSEQGTPSPTVGAHTGDYGRAVTCSINGDPIAAGDGTQYVQRGWSGTGCVPSNGSAAHVDVVLTNDSSITWNWARQCRLFVTSGGHGQVAPVSGWYDADSNVTVSAVPDAHYRFTAWTGSDLPEGLSNRADIVLGMNRAYTLQANFDTNPVRITATSDGASCGTMTPTGIVEAAPGGNVTFTLEPGPHCRGYLVVDGAYLGETNSYSFTNVIEDHTIHAVFEKETVNLRVGSTTPGGRFKPASGVLTVEWGSNVLCSATNSPVTNGLERYTCTGWTGSGSVSNTGEGITAGPFTLEADSEIIWQWGTEYWLEVEVGAYGSVDTPSGWYAGQTNLRATAEPHSSFVGWTGDTNGLTMVGNLISVPMDRSYTIGAVFKRDERTFTIESAWGGCVPPPGVYVYDYGSTVNCTVTNSPIYQGVSATQIVCAGYSGTDGIGQGIVTQVTVTLTNSETLTWLWQTNLFLHATSSTGGAVTNEAGGGVPVSGWLRAGTNVVLWASPQNYYAFSGWTGDLAGVTLESNRATFVMSRPRSLEALFDAFATSNGVPYWWMAQFGITTNFEAQSGLDPDEDGYRTEEEWITNTDPTNAASRLEVLALQRGTNGNRVTWSSVTNRTYALLRATNLLEAVRYEVIASNLTVAIPEAAYTDTNPPSGTLLFYAVEAALPADD